MPRNANGSGSIRRREITKPNGKTYIFYEARVTVGKDPITGKQKQKSFTGKSKTEVRKKMSEVITQVDSRSYVEPCKQSLESWLDIWLDTYVEGKVKPYTLDSYRSICNTHIKPTLGQIKLCELSPIYIQQFYNALEKTLSAKTVRNVHGVLHRALDRAAILHIIPSNPSDICELPKLVKRHFDPIEQPDVKRLMDIWHRDRFERIYLVTLFTGMREGEVLGLSWDNIDFEAGTIYICQQLTKTKQVGGEYCLAPTKNSQSRLIFVAPTVMGLLRKQRSTQRKWASKAKSGWHNEWNLVFTNELGRHLTHRTVYKGFKASVRALGMDDIRFHDLRHTFAVASLEAGDSIKTVQQNLGHSSAAFTMNTYAHVSQKMQKRSAVNMEHYISEVSRL